MSIASCGDFMDEKIRCAHILVDKESKAKEVLESLRMVKAFLNWHKNIQ
jgi:hypothetical protein